MRARVSDEPRFLTLASLRWVVQHRAWSPGYLVRYLRFLLLRVRHPGVVTRGFVFLDKDVRFEAPPGAGRIVLGRWVHLGAGTRLRAHEGTLRIGDKVVLGARTTLNVYLDVEIGDSALAGDDLYVCDFDHRFDSVQRPIKDQGITKSPVRIGADCWLGTKVTVLRGTEIGVGAVIGAGSVVRGDIPAYALAAGVPAQVKGTRRPEGLTVTGL